jgi:Uncharacterised nucleotidyltransferase/Transglutaminase-like superfamily
MSASTGEPPGLHMAMRTLRIDVVTAEVFAALADAGIPSVLLKGPSIARWIYDTPGRPYEDCDLLVRQSDLERAQLTLRSLGFECRGLDSMPGDWPKHAAVYRRGSVFVDLHRTLLGVGADSDRLWDALAPHREPMRVGGADVDVLDPAGRALVLALHAAKDGGRAEKPLRDLERALDALELDVWRSASDIATEVGAGAAFAAGLRRVPAGRAVCEGLDLTGHVTPEIALREEAAPPLSAGIDWLLRSPGSSSKARLVLRKLFPPPAFMRDWSSLARRGPAGLALAYGWRLVWVAWRVVPALGAVIRARSEADRSRVGSRSEALRLPMWTKVGLATRIWIAFVRTRLTERRLPLPEAARRLAEAGRARTRVDPRRLGRIVGRVLRVGPWRPRCLFSALVLYRLLREQGDDADLVIGLGADPRSKDAHAWVEVDGVDAGPPPGRGGRTALARYPLRSGG